MSVKKFKKKMAENISDDKLQHLYQLIWHICCIYSNLYHTVDINNNKIAPFDDEGCSFLADLGRKISVVSGDDRDSTFLFQRISVLIQRHNSILLRHSFCDETQPDDDL